MCERRGRKTQKHVQAPVSCLTVSLEFTGPCGDFTVMIVIKKYLLNFNWRLLKQLAETMLPGGGAGFKASH